MLPSFEDMKAIRWLSGDQLPLIVSQCCRKVSCRGFFPSLSEIQISR
jgi:hypothetical protein